jgi:hypothetical protein
MLVFFNSSVYSSEALLSAMGSLEFPMYPGTSWSSQLIYVFGSEHLKETSQRTSRLAFDGLENSRISGNRPFDNLLILNYEIFRHTDHGA